MKQSLLLLILVIILTACGPAPTPVVTPNFNETVMVLSSTMVAATLTAQPTLTQLPTVTPLPSSTPTIQPTVTATPDPISLTALAATLLPAVPTATDWAGTLSPGNTEGLPTGLLRIENNTSVKEISITLTGTTLAREQPVYLAYKVNGSLNLTIFWARYQYVIQVPGKGIFQGTFTQQSKDKTTIRVFDKKIVVVGP